MSRVFRKYSFFPRLAATEAAAEVFDMFVAFPLIFPAAFSFCRCKNAPHLRNGLTQYDMNDGGKEFRPVGGVKGVGPPQAININIFTLSGRCFAIDAAIAHPYE